jgi:hypothetical protein
MSTHSSIGILELDGSITAIYCHSDGYFSWNGEKLFNHYNSEALARELVGMGFCSILYETIGEKHDFSWMESFKRIAGETNENFWARRDADPRAKMSRFYKRDRGDDDMEVERFADLAEFEAHAERYAYLWDMHRGAWIGQDSNVGDWHLLSDLAVANWGEPRDNESGPPAVPAIPALADNHPVIDEEDELLARALF